LPDTLPLQAALAGHYLLEHQVGRGAMATVYLARDLRHDRPVALKVIHPELVETVASGRFLREIRLAGRLQHPHIIPMLDSGEAEGRLWYTMPYVRGESLRALLERERVLPIEDAVELAKQIALALDYAHRDGVIHRDLKPENILLSDGQALIVDFGLAKALEASDRLTGNGVAVGTGAYMSPEQASGGVVDGRADLYSLGCLLYEMLVGEPPFFGATVQAVITQRFTMAPPSVRRVRPEVSEALDNVIRQTLALDPVERFANGADLAQALVRRVPEPAPEPHVPASSRLELASWVGRWLVPLVLAALAGLLGQGILAR
jgi:eukaryotic-like serine/threonine-protein kinase